jgi:peptide/nickel transport system substrate-binding protein
VSGPDVTRLVQDTTLKHSTYGGSYLSPLVFNQLTPGALMKDDAIRQAVFTAIDPKSFLQADTGGFGITSSSILAPSAQCYDATTSRDQPAHTVASAQKVMTGAGYTLGADGKLTRDGRPVPLRILSTSANFGQGPEYLADTLNKVGFNVTLSNPDFQTYVTQLTSLQYDVATEYLSGGLLPSSSALYVSGPTAFSKQGTNQSGNEDPAVYQAALAAMKESGSAACRDWSQFQHLLLQHHDLLPLDQRTQQFFGKGFTIQEPSGYLWISSIRRTA